MNFGLDLNKLLVIGVIAVVLIGPERLPHYAEMLARFLKRSGEYLKGAKERVAEEMGPEFTETDWRKLDPRQYDPRRIIRDAILEPDAPSAAPSVATTTTTTATATAAAATAGAAGTFTPRRRKAPVRLAAFEVPPFDSEAT